MIVNSNGKKVFLSGTYTVTETAKKIAGSESECLVLEVRGASGEIITRGESDDCKPLGEHVVQLCSIPSPLTGVWYPTGKEKAPDGLPRKLEAFDDECVIAIALCADGCVRPVAVERNDIITQTGVIVLSRGDPSLVMPFAITQDPTIAPVGYSIVSPGVAERMVK